MLDQFGRKIEYMRISLTNNCNLRCSYCMPEKRISDVHFFPMNQVLRCVESAVSLGITHFRLTGGEPLCYPKIEELLCKIKQIKGVDSVHLTTNGVLLKEKAAQLKQTGIDSINVSLDTPDEKEYRVLTGGGKLSNVLDGIRKAAELEIPVKINAVLREQTDVCALAAFAEQNHVTLRFIEMMPIGYGRQFEAVSNEEIRKKLELRYPEMAADHAKKKKSRFSGKIWIWSGGILSLFGSGYFHRSDSGDPWKILRPMQPRPHHFRGKIKALSGFCKSDRSASGTGRYRKSRQAGRADAAGDFPEAEIASF